MTDEKQDVGQEGQEEKREEEIMLDAIRVKGEQAARARKDARENLDSVLESEASSSRRRINVLRNELTLLERRVG